ncbi:MAG: ZPR1 zinc finger domain-containing protein [Candidatus Thorarchaeota archaeon]
MNDDFDIRCPICNEQGLEVSSILYSVPYFNQIAMFTVRCPHCHFSHNDVFTTEQRSPSRWTLYVDSPELLRARVIRSSSGTIRLPEFGIDIEPGPMAESFITNVEGVLQRTRPVVETAINFAERPEEKARGAEVLAMIDRAIEGSSPFTILIEDPAGISSILPDDMSKVKHEELSPEDASKLRGAPLWVDTLRDELQERKD